VVLTTVSEITAEFPTNYQGAPEQHNEQSAAATNALIAETVASQDDQPPFYTIADWNAAVMAPGDETTPSGEELYLSDDRIHQNVAGAYKMTELQLDALAQCPTYPAVNG